MTPRRKSDADPKSEAAPPIGAPSSSTGAEPSTGLDQLFGAEGALGSRSDEEVAASRAKLAQLFGHSPADEGEAGAGLAARPQPTSASFSGMLVTRDQPADARAAMSRSMSTPSTTNPTRRSGGPNRPRPRLPTHSASRISAPIRADRGGSAQRAGGPEPADLEWAAEADPRPRWPRGRIRRPDGRDLADDPTAGRSDR